MKQSDRPGSSPDEPGLRQVSSGRKLQDSGAARFPTTFSGSSWGLAVTDWHGNPPADACCCRMLPNAPRQPSHYHALRVPSFPALSRRTARPSGSSYGTASSPLGSIRLGNLETLATTAKAGVQFIDFAGLQCSPEWRIQCFSRRPLSSFKDGPLGCLSPPSHFCTVDRLVFSTAASTAWLIRARSRRDLIFCRDFCDKMIAYQR